MAGRLLTLTACALTGWLAAASVAAQERGWERGWPMHPITWMWGAWGIVMMLMMFGFWALVIAGLVLGVRWLTRSLDARRADPALDILRQRYARGEIDRQEFEAKRRDLMSRD